MTRDLPLPNYTGIDPSSEAIRLAKLTRPDGDYRVGTLADHPTGAELTLCLDVLAHQADPTRYRATVKSLLDHATRALLVSSYEGPPTTDSTMEHFHEPLSTTLRELAPKAEVYPLPSGDGAAFFLVLLVPEDAHHISTTARPPSTPWLRSTPICYDSSTCARPVGGPSVSFPTMLHDCGNTRWQPI